MLRLASLFPGWFLIAANTSIDLNRATTICRGTVTLTHCMVDLWSLMKTHELDKYLEHRLGCLYRQV